MSKLQPTEQGAMERDKTFAQSLREAQHKAHLEGQAYMRDLAASVRLEGTFTPEEYALLHRMSEAIRSLPIE